MVANSTNPATGEDGLSEQQRAVLEHIRLFRITTQDLARRACFPADATPAGVDSFFARLRKRGLVRAAQLIGTEKYYHLTPAVYQTVFNENAVEERVGSYAVVEWYGRLLFCMRHPDMRRKLHWTEFDRAFPMLRDPRQPRRHAFYVDKETGVHRLGMIYVDPGNRFDRVANRLRNKLIGGLLAQKIWREQLIDGDRFTLTVVCTSPVRASQLLQELDPANQCPRIRFCVEALPELLPLVHRRHSESNRNRGKTQESA